VNLSDKLHEVRMVSTDANNLKNLNTVTVMEVSRLEWFVEFSNCK